MSKSSPKCLKNNVGKGELACYEQFVQYPVLSEDLYCRHVIHGSVWERYKGNLMFNSVELHYNAVPGVHGSDPQYIQVFAVFTHEWPVSTVDRLISYYDYIYYISYHILRICWYC